MSIDFQLFIQSALAEDIGSGDITTLSTIPVETIGCAEFYVKEDCVIAGIELTKMICKEVDPDMEYSFLVEDGMEIIGYQKIGKINGNIASILIAERLILNCMQRMSAIATKTRKLSTLLAPYGIMAADTRKTTPNFRICEKMAVKIGGGFNHRFGLYDAILIKDNHIKAAGGIKNAIESCEKYLISTQQKFQVIVEVKDLHEFNIAKNYAIVDRLLLDNFKPEIIRDTLQYNITKKKIEISGGISMDNIHDYLIEGVDLISMGDLTHHISSIDISLKII